MLTKNFLSYSSKMNQNSLSPLNKTTLQNNINHYAKKHIPFFFIINFEKSEGYFLPHQGLTNKKILFSFPHYSNYTNLAINCQNKHTLQITKKIDYKSYTQQFAQIQRELSQGHTFLLNLTQSTLINTQLNLLEIFYLSNAKYKIYLQDQFVCFSPETFINIDANGKIATYPMKGTINANIPNAKQILKKNPKEIAEHQTIVDLMRNDLNMVAKKIKVDYFRYFEIIQTQQRNIYQTSSKISGQLPDNYLSYLGNIIFQLLPAGSISGAPKKSTVKIIQQIETHQRGYYTGIAGYFDGQSLDTCVLIRFIEQQNNQLFYKSGGGITAYSQAKKEYVELLEKIYLPLMI